MILVLRRILERPGATGSLRKASDYYAACTNTAAIEAKGLAPLAPSWPGSQRRPA